MNQLANKKFYVGIDVAAMSVTAAWGSQVDQIGEAHVFQQSKAGHQKLVKAVKQAQEPGQEVMVIMEATGTYWMQVAVAMYRAGWVVSVINPRQAHNFAEALMKQAKTDAIDARSLTQLAMTLPVKAWEPPGPVWEALYQRLVEHDNLTQMKQMLGNQLHALKQRTQVDPQVMGRKQQLITELTDQLKTIKRELQICLKDSPWAPLARQLQTIPGIGLLSAAWLLVITNGFTTCENAQQLTSYLGLAPHPQQSGTSRQGYRPIGRSGHARARRVLHQAGVVAACHNPPVRTFYQRLRDRGKPVKVARCAAARKLIHIVFGVATSDQPFNPVYHLPHQHPLSA